MNAKVRGLSCLSAVLLILSIAGCQVAGTASTTVDDAASQQTAIADAAAATLTAQAPLVETEVPVTASTPERTVTEAPSQAATTDPASITHITVPNAQTSGVNVVSDTDSTNMATAGRALGGDDYSANLFERPFDAEGMVYHPELDIKVASIGSDTYFYYVNISLSGVNPVTGLLDGTYGVELDTDADGRGEYMVLAYPQLTADWSTTTLWAGDDLDGDVGGLHPMAADAPEGSTGYEETLFVYDQGTDPDIAWARLGTLANTVQIAFKRSLIRGDSDFLWSAWSNGGDTDITLQDINDIIMPEDAGSPIQGVAYFPLNEVDLMDNTCRMPAGFTPVGNEPGLCANLRSTAIGGTVTPTSTMLPVSTVAPTLPPVTPANGDITIFLFEDTNGNGIVDGSESAYLQSDVETVFSFGTCPGTSVIDDYYRGGATAMNLAAGWYCISIIGHSHTITPVSYSSVQVLAGTGIQVNFGVVP
jgi:hypothetical protein